MNSEIKHGSIQRGELSMPCYQYQNNKTPLFFMAANGMPWLSYSPFLELFTEHFSPSGFDSRGAWLPHKQPSKSHSSKQHESDIICFIEAHYDKPVVALGHSMGGTLLAKLSVKRPDLFKQIILIDPAGFSNPFMNALYPLIPLSLKQRYPLIKTTINRRNGWPSHEAFKQDMRTKKTYKNFTDDCMNAYATEGLLNNPNNKPERRFTLRYQPVWEGHNFSHVSTLWPALKKCSVPTIFIHCEKSYLYTPKQISQIKTNFSQHVTTLNLKEQSHMVVQELPEWLFETLMEYITGDNN